MAESRKNNSKVFSVRIHKASCKACGLCADFCPNGVLVPDEFGYPVVTDSAKCTGCNLCFYRCPDLAIEVQSVEQSPEDGHGR